MYLALRYVQPVVATKYLGGHSDLLSGVLIVKTLEEWGKVWTFLVTRSLTLTLHTLALGGPCNSWWRYGLLGIVVAVALVAHTPPPCPTAVCQRHCVSSVAGRHRVYSQGPDIRWCRGWGDKEGLAFVFAEGRRIRVVSKPANGRWTQSDLRNFGTSLTPSSTLT